MITLLVGHRGTGKSELIQRLGFYLRDENVVFIDLDLEIEKKIGKSIRELFGEHGEEYFRELERQMFLETLQKPHDSMYLVAGAGFDLSVVPEAVRVLWVRRRTDDDGRIFLDRPRLHPELPPLEEFQKRARERERSYAEAADEVYLMPEGSFKNQHYVMSLEKDILTHKLSSVGGSVTLTAGLFRKESRWQLFKNRLSGRGLDFFELRDDFLTLEQIQRVLQELPQEKFIFSFRHPQESWFTNPELLEVLQKVQLVDWPLELGEPREILKLVPRERLVISSHSVEEEALNAFQDQAGGLKYSPLLETFADLQRGHQWQQAASDRRSFLPRSAQGQWSWYRLYMKGRQPINFWREGDGSAFDQPSLFDWLRTTARAPRFAAVVGSPIFHSYTPVEQAGFFAKKNTPIFAITIARGAWDQAWPFLQDLGLRWAAVTAPHKNQAALQVLGPEGTELAMNTLYFSEKKNKWLGASTDEEGFLELLEGVGMLAPLQKEIFVWGGGGTLAMIQKALPRAVYFSSRTGQLRAGQDKLEGLSPKVLVWAAPRLMGAASPPKEWKPALVIDLNYQENSAGREYAQLIGCNYRSGLEMFLAQARGQRVFWSQCEEQE